MGIGTRLYGRVNAPNNATTVTFEYSLTSAYDTTVTADVPDTSGTTAT